MGPVVRLLGGPRACQGMDLPVRKSSRAEAVGRSRTAASNDPRTCENDCVAQSSVSRSVDSNVMVSNTTATLADPLFGLTHPDGRVFYRPTKGARMWPARVGRIAEETRLRSPAGASRPMRYGAAALQG